MKSLLSAISVCVVLVLSLGSGPLNAQEVSKAYTAKNEVQEITKKLGIEPRFKDYKPDFKIEKVKESFMGPNGPYEVEITYIKDGDKYVGLFWGRPAVELLVSDPALAKTKLEKPARYHNATLHGTRLTTIAWIGRWGHTGDKTGREFTGGGDSVTFTEWQEYKGDGLLGVNGKSLQSYTWRVDPYAGYVIDVKASFISDGVPKYKGKVIDGFEFTNMLNGRMSNVWVGESQYERTVYTPSKKDKYAEHAYAGWVNNVVASDQSDNGRRTETRDGGFLCFLDRDAWSVLLTRSGNVNMSLTTCNVWQDQHQHVDFPKQPDADGKYRMEWQARLQFVPPKFSNYLWDQMHVDAFNGKSAVMIPLGVPVDFEDQPLPLTSPVKGMANPYALHIADGVAFSGKKSLVLKADDERIKSGPLKKLERKWKKKAKQMTSALEAKKEAEFAKAAEQGELALKHDRGIFLHLPQVPLKPDTEYLIEAMVKVPEGASFSITGDLYEWTPHDHKRLKRQDSNVIEGKAGDEWQKVTLRFKSPNFDPFIDVRFRPRGKGQIYVDDFQFVEVAKMTQAD